MNDEVCQLKAELSETNSIVAKNQTTLVEMQKHLYKLEKKLDHKNKNIKKDSEDL